MTNPTAIAKEVASLAAATPKPVLAAWLGGAGMHEGKALMNDSGVPTYVTPEQAVVAFMTLVSYSRNLDTLYETPKDIPVEFPVDREETRRRFGRFLDLPGDVLSESDSKDLLASYGIPSTRPETASTAEEAVRAAAGLGYPVVLKILSPDITHKSDVGGVALGLEDGDRSGRRSSPCSGPSPAAPQAPASKASPSNRWSGPRTESR